MAREAKSRGIRWRLWLGLVALGVVCVSTGLAARKAHHFVITGRQFALPAGHPEAIQIAGIRHAPRQKILRVFAADFGRSVFAIPLDERRRRLMALDWVEEASISRLWPNRLMIRITERKPVAFVLFHSGVMLIDAQGVLLEPPTQVQFAFPVLSGVRDDETEGQRKVRVAAMLRLLGDLGSRAKDISEVNAAEPEDLKVVAQVDGRVVELLMGEGNYAWRYQNFLQHYPEIRKRRENVTSFDLRLDDRISAKE